MVTSRRQVGWPVCCYTHIHRVFDTQVIYWDIS